MRNNSTSPDLVKNLLADKLRDSGYNKNTKMEMYPLILKLKRRKLLNNHAKKQQQHSNMTTYQKQPKTL